MNRKRKINIFIKSYIIAFNKQSDTTFYLKRATGALILKTVVEGAPLNPIHCWRLRAVAQIIPEVPAMPGLYVSVLNI